MATSEGRTGTDWRGILPSVLLAFLASRLLLVAIVLLVQAWNPPWDRPSYASGLLLQGLTGHDAIYYLGIAADGYHQEPVRGPYTDWVFFPAFPLVTRVASVLTLGNIAVAGVLAANLALLVAMVLMVALIAPSTDRRVVRDSAVLVAFAPGAVAFGMAYSDSLMLAAGAGALLAARRDRLWLAAALYGLATLARSPGILLGVALLAVTWGDRRVPSRRVLVLAAGPLAIAAFAAYQWAVLGDPLAFVHGQAAWNIPPITAAPQEGTASAGDDWYILPMVGLLIGTLLAYTALLPGLWRSGIPRPEVFVALAAFASVFISGRLQSDARYLAVGWSFAWLVASGGARLRRAGIALSVTGFIVYGLLNVSQLLAP